MQLLLILEALKIHKVKHERAVQFWFVGLYALNIIPYLMPFADRDFSRFQAAMEQMMQSMAGGQMPAQSVLDLLSRGNLALLFMATATTLVTTFFGLAYASLIIAERYQQGPTEAVLKSLSALPRLILMSLVLFIPALLSAFVAFIPLLIFVVLMYFLPLYLAWTKKGLLDAMQHSLQATQGHRIRIFFLVILLSILVSLPQNMILGLAPHGGLPYVLLSSFFTVFRALIQGRLMGFLYLQLVKKEPDVLPSRPNKTS